MISANTNRRGSVRSRTVSRVCSCRRICEFDRCTRCERASDVPTAGLTLVSSLFSHYVCHANGTARPRSGDPGAYDRRRERVYAIRMCLRANGAKDEKEKYTMSSRSRTSRSSRSLSRELSRWFWDGSFIPTLKLLPSLSYSLPCFFFILLREPPPPLASHLSVQIAFERTPRPPRYAVDLRNRRDSLVSG